MSKWKCPKCKHTFTNKNQPHSCAPVKVGSLFEGKPPALKKVYEKILKAVKKFGEVNISAVKSGIMLKRAGTFSSITFRKDHLKVEFFLPEKQDAFPVEKTFQFTKTKIVHVVSVSNEQEVDKQLIGWLRASYLMTTH